MAKQKSAASKSPSLVTHPTFEVGQPKDGKRGNVEAAEHKQHRAKKDANKRKRNKGRS